MSDPGTPRPGIRLAGGAPIPPAPSLGNHRPISKDGRRLGGITETQPATWIPACIHPDCWTALDARATARIATVALRGHWALDHSSAAA
jgi:hypothetical protein